MASDGWSDYALRQRSVPSDEGSGYKEAPAEVFFENKQWGREFMGDQERIDHDDAQVTARMFRPRAGWRCINGFWKEVC